MIARTRPGQRPPAPRTDRTRVLLLIKGLGRGGAEQLVVNSVACGDASRFEYHVAYLLPWKDAFVGDLRRLDVPVDCLDGAKGLGWVARLGRLVRARDIQIVHVHSPYVAAMVRGAALGRGRPRLVTTEHNVWDRYHRATYWANAITFPRNDHVFAVSREVEESVRFPVPLRSLRKPPMETLHHGVDVAAILATPPANGIREELGLPESATVVGTVANFKEHKGHHHLLRVAERVVKQRSDVRFVLVGGGPRQEEIQRDARERGLGDAVVFTGFRPDAHRIMRTFDIYFLASTHEGLPLSLLEAMVLGCPVVATDVGGVSAAVVDGGNGYVVAATDADLQAERIVDLIDDPGLRARFAEAAHTSAAGLDVRNAVRRIEDVYAGLVT